MSLKVYIDTNIFLDSILDRDNGISKSILYFLKIRNIEVILNDVSVINIHYFAEKKIKTKFRFIERIYWKYFR